MRPLQTNRPAGSSTIFSDKQRHCSRFQSNKKTTKERRGERESNGNREWIVVICQMQAPIQIGSEYGVCGVRKWKNEEKARNR